MHTTLKIWALTLLAGNAFGQTLLTPDAAVAATLQQHPTIRAAAFDVQAKQYGEKAALNVPNPEIITESPTGELYVLGASQSFAFPTVYARQKQVAKAETALALVGQRIGQNDLRYTMRLLYLDTQVAEYQSQQWAVRDSVYQRIATAATRQFTAGEVDVIAKTMAENEAGKVHQQRLAAQQSASVLRLQLAVFTGLSDWETLLPLEADTTQMPGIPGIENNPSVVYQQQAAQVAEEQVRLAKSRALPDLSVGYLNQGARSTPVIQRFQAGIGLPLWAGQYRAATNAAEAERQAAVARAEAQGQALTMEYQRTQSEAATAYTNVQYHQREALPRSQALVAAATRMREAGQLDYVSFLRTLDEAYAIQREYALQIQALNTAKLRLQYFLGN